MRALVVGGAGFVGSHLVDRLLAEGHTVDVIDDLSTGSLRNLASARSVAAGTLKFHHLDVRADEVDELVGRREPDCVYHLAVLPPGLADRPAVERSIAGTLNLLEACARNGVAKVVTTVPGVALYGAAPVSELPVKEGRSWTPTGIRSVAARAVVDLLDVHRAERSLEFTALALGSVYGPRQRPADGVVARFVEAAIRGEAPELHGDGRQTRDFVYVDDVVDAVVRAAQRGSGLVVNVATGVQTSIRQLLAMVPGSAVAKPALRRASEIGRFAASPVRARIHLSWAPWTTLAAGVAATHEAMAADAAG